MREAQCQPFWIERSLEPALKPCQNASQFDKFMEKYELLQQPALQDLVAEHKCLIPCAYTQYEVNY